MKHSTNLVFATAAAAALFSMGSAQAVELYGQGSTEGAGVGIGTGLNGIIPSAPSWIGLRAEVNAMPTISHKFSSGHIDYDADLRLRSADGYVDVFPFPNSALSGFHLTGGALFNDDKADGNGVYDRSIVSIGGQSYNISGQSVHGHIRYPAVMPYAGLGFGHNPKTKGFSFFGDIGVAFGRPHVDLSLNPSPLVSSLPSPVLAVVNAQVQSERQDLQHTVDRYRFFPVIKIGVSYRF